MSRVAPRAIASAIVTALLVAVFLPTTAAGVASAHAGGLSSSASLPRVLAVEPAAPGVTVTVAESGARLRLDNTSTSTVTVQPLPGAQLSGLPTVEPGGTAYWSDPWVTAAAAQDRPAVGVLPWQIPLLVGDTPVTVRGEQVWPPAPAAALWWLLALACAAVPVLLGLLGRDRRWGPVALAAATGVVIVANLVHVAGSALVPEQQAYPLMVLSAANFGVAAWLVGAAGAAVVRNRSRVSVAGGAPGRLQEAKQAKIASLVVKLGAVGFIIFVDPQFSIDLQLIGGVIILQTLPAVAIALYTAGCTSRRWWPGGSSARPRGSTCSTRSRTRQPVASTSVAPRYHWTSWTCWAGTRSPAHRCRSTSGS